MRRARLIFIAFLALAALAGCKEDSTNSSSGGTSDASTGNVDDPGTEPIDGGATDSGAVESIEATVEGKKAVFTKDRAYLYKATSHLVVRGKGGKGEFLLVEFPGSPGTFSCAQGSKIQYEDANSHEYAASGGAQGGPDCTVTVTKSGQIGELIEGTFVASVTATGDVGSSPSLLSIAGSFSVIRGADINR